MISLHKVIILLYILNLVGARGPFRLPQFGRATKHLIDLERPQYDLFSFPRGGSDIQQPSLQETILASTGNVTNSTNISKTSNVTSPRISWKSNLPFPLCNKGPKTLQRLRLGGITVYLLGTAHISNDSSAETALLLDSIRPTCVMVELCDARVPLLEGQADEEDNNGGSNTTFWKQVRNNQEEGNATLFQSICTVLLSRVQQDYADDLGVELGGEFRCAHQHWLRHPSSHLILGDRPLSLTLVRAWESLSILGKVKVVIGLLWSSFRKPNPKELREWLQSVLREETDVLTESFQELRKQFPTLYTTIIEERDAWLAAKIVQTARALQPGPSTIVAIVGAGHMKGICQWLTEPTNSGTPEEILYPLAQTKKWAEDALVQQQMIPTWVKEVTELTRDG